MERHTYPILYRIESDHWWHSSRRELVLDQIAEFYNDRRDLRMVDAGCGTGLMLRELERFGDAQGVDISDDALAFCRDRGLTCVHKGSLTEMPFEDGSVDVVTVLDVLEHIEDQVAALREIRRVLKPGGRLFLFAPAHDWLWSLQDEISHHVRRYTKRSLASATQSADLEIDRLTYVNFFLLPAIYLGRLALKVVLRFKTIESENGLHPAWSNGILSRIFRSEIPILRRSDLPFGASLLLVARRADA
jgi:SAM-dependent methyltransferase